ncbi:MAG: cell division protein ZapA [Bacteriovoracaceae bacterium]|jgi:cell division protein ZapA (FtsZ GTPase activity inhibitor)|nr:cell division protein ZapA [Bacteriovoracaceae bacterium]
MENLEYNILGSKIKLKEGQADQDQALRAINYVNEQVQNLLGSNHSLKDIDAAVLVSLQLAAKLDEVQKEYKDTVSLFKGEITEALEIINSFEQDHSNA